MALNYQIPEHVQPIAKFIDKFLLRSILFFILFLLIFIVIGMHEPERYEMNLWLVYTISMCSALISTIITNVVLPTLLYKKENGGING